MLKQSAARRDAVAIGALVVGYFLLACQYEFAETVVDWAGGYERWELDEVLMTLALLAGCLAWYGWRRTGENRRLAGALLAVQEQERRAIARELHDELGQSCSAIRADAACVARELPDGSPARASAQAIASSAERIQGAVRSMLRRLRPAALDELGLAACVQDLAERWQQRHAIACEFVPVGRLDGLGETLDVAVYRIVQECLTNVAKHSGARHAAVRIARERSAVRVSVEDDGRGLPARPGAGAGFGMLGMSERASALGGVVRSRRGALGGLRVEAVLPLPA